MRTSRLAILLFLALMLSISAAAQSPTATPPQQPSAAAPSQGAPSQSAPAPSTPQADDDNPLNLTEEQKSKLRPILIDERMQMESLRNDTSLSDDQKVEKAHQIRAAAAPKIKAVLTPEQLKKLADMQQKAMQQQSPSAPAQPAPPPHN